MRNTCSCEMSSWSGLRPRRCCCNNKLAALLLLLLWLDEDKLVGVVVVVVALDVDVAAAEEQIGSTLGPGDGV